MQSSGAVGSITAAFAGNGLINLSTAVYILIGASLGTTITAIVIALITASKQRRDFRHGFEIALCYSIYSAILVIIVLILESSLKFFSRTALFLASGFSEKISVLKIPNIIDTITEPIIHTFFENANKLLLLIFAFAILIFTLKYLGKVIIKTMGGEEEARKGINKYFKSKYTAYLLRFILTAIIFSSSITIGLLVPLAVSRIISLRKAIPFILGADLGTTTDVFVASLFIGNTNAIACFFAFALFAVIGAILFLPNTKLLYKMTKYVSKKIMHVSRKRALIVLLILILVPLGIILI